MKNYKAASKALRFNSQKIKSNKLEGKLLFEYNQILQSKIKLHINSSFKLFHTNHAIEQAKEDILGSFELPTALPTKYTVQELEQTNGKSTKFVLRFEYNKDLDMQIVIRPDRKVKNAYCIITAWLIEANNYHSDVDMTPYATPDKVVY